MSIKIDSIVDFAKHGLNTDVIPWMLPGDFVTRLNNIRIKNGKLIPFGGYTARKILPMNSNPGLIFPVGDFDGWVICGDSDLYLYKDTNVISIGPTGGFSVDSNDWYSCNLSGVPIVSNIGYYPMYSPDIDQSNQFELLPWDATNTWQDVNQQCDKIRSHKQFLFALGVSDNGNYYPESVRWSSPADVGSLPETWDHLDITNVAGLIALGGEGGPIVDGRSLRDSFVIYRKKGINVFDFVGGSYVWQNRILSETFGSISPNCIAEVNGKHYFIGDGDIFVNDGNSIESLLYGRIKELFSKSFNTTTFANSYVVNNTTSNELWFCIPGPGATYPTKVFMYNWVDESWSVRDIIESISMGYGAKGVQQSSSWDFDTTSWDSDNSSWDNEASTPFNNTIFSITNENPSRIVQLDGFTSVTDIAFDFLIERSQYAIESPLISKSINCLYPHVQGIGSITFELAAHEGPGLQPHWKQPVQFDPATMRKVDILSRGLLHTFRLSGTTNSSSMAIAGMQIQYVLGGDR